MRAEITYFASLTDVQGQRVCAPWSGIFEHFGRPKVCACKEAAPGWSPAIYEDNSRAAGKRALSLGALVVEYDHDVSFDDACAIWADFWGAAYTTFNHRPDAPRLRIVLPLSRRVSVEEHARLWRWAESVGGAIDPNARDAKRFWYLPAHAPGAPFEMRELTGAILDVDEVLAQCTAPTLGDCGRVSRETAPKPERAVLCETALPPSVVERARQYLGTIPGAVSGQGGHNATFRVAIKLVHGFALDPGTALELLRQWNRTCDPPWSEGELAHKIKDADRAPSDRPRGFLLDAGARGGAA